MVKEFDTLIDVLVRMGFEWELHIDEDEPSKELYAKGSVEGIDIRVYCNPKECKVYAPEYRAAAPCYSKPAPVIVKCLIAVVERVNELIEKTVELAELADMLLQNGFNVSREDNGIYAVKRLNDGLIEITIPADGNSTLKLEIRTKTPIKTVIAATELARLAEQLKL
jgi:hypothetical protein